MRVTETLTSEGLSFEWESYEDYLPDEKEISKRYPWLKKTTAKGAWTTEQCRRWFGTDSYASVVHKTQNGWPELREAMLKLVKDVELDLPIFPTMTTVRKRKRKRDEYGDELDIDRVWNGQLDTAWEYPARVTPPALNTKRITLAFDVTANATVTNSMAMWRAALCMLLTDSLARAGRTFEVWTTFSTRDSYNKGPSRTWMAWCVKRAHEPIVPDRMCAMVSIGYMRSTGFMALGAGRWEPVGWLGSALNAGLPHRLRERQKAGEVVLRIGECYSREAMLREYKKAWEEVEDKSRGETHEDHMG